MSGGEAYVLDEAGRFRDLCNPGMVDLEPVEAEQDIRALRELLTRHLRHTGSANADRVLRQWERMVPRFVKVMPRDYKRVLAERAAALVNGGVPVEVAGDG
jgi:glutamate synthase domain-containing protein 3